MVTLHFLDTFEFQFSGSGLAAACEDVLEEFAVILGFDRV
jgi:hypothetical protein